jgi:16S rRNA (guanine(966)-N(2))-methyltransferase RsmD
MRVISGSARGTKLKLVPGDTTRPIMDRVKENLFNLLDQDYLVGARWLDLFAGTGQVGIEALSRGAEHVVFVDTARAAIKTIQANLETTRFVERATIRRADAFAYLESSNSHSFDVIYIAPPQYHGVWVGALTAVELRIDQLLLADGIVVVQIDPREFQELHLGKLQLYKQKKYGNTMLCFYEHAATP